MKIIGQNNICKVIITIDCIYKCETTSKEYNNSLMPYALEQRKIKLMNKVFDAIRQQFQADQIEIIK